MTDTHGLLLEVRDEITRIHYTEVKPHGLMYHEPGARPNLCTSCALIARIDAALAQQAPAEQAGWKLVPVRALVRLGCTMELLAGNNNPDTHRGWAQEIREILAASPVAPPETKA